VEIDGFTQNEAIVVVAATNKPEVLDPALTRSGRFDRKVHVNYPDKKSRKGIIDLYLQKDGDETVDVDHLARETVGLSGADLYNLVNSARISAAKAERMKVSRKDLSEAFEMVTMGRDRRSRVMSEHIRVTTAYHEMGHALLGLFTNQPVTKITLIPRGQALGVTRFSPSEDDLIQKTKQQFNAELIVGMGGRAAEELHKGRDKITSGASSDIESATNLARNMVSRFGMSDSMGPMNYTDKHLSPQARDLCDAETKRMLDSAYKKALNILTDHRLLLDECARALLEYETMTGDELVSFIEKHSGPTFVGAWKDSRL